ncbi:MAG: hypothetical protein AABY04_04155 [Candidatus Micrarchaeota archaeon]
MNKLNILFSETALELMPIPLQSNGMILDEAKKRHVKVGNTLLDSNKHHIPMHILPNFEKRGRPDILHFSLLTALESIVNKEGKLGKILSHTQADVLLEIRNETRLPRIYNRFVGIIEQALSGGKNEFISIKPNTSFEVSLEAAMEGSKKPSIYFFNEFGKETKLMELGKMLKEDMENDLHVLFVFGCFPHGNFSDETRNLLLKKGAKEIRLSKEILPVWTLVSSAINTYGLEAGL